MRVVLDTSVLVSATIRPQGRVGEVTKQLAAGAYTIVYSAALRDEVLEVLGRGKIRQKYGVEERHVRAVEELLHEQGELVTAVQRIADCRDLKDDKVLEAAVAGHADLIVASDGDLRVLSSFEGIRIVSPAAFLEMLGAENDQRGGD